MPSLLHSALQAKQKTTLPEPLEEEDLLSQVSEEEREEIYSQINADLEKNRLQVDQNTYHFAPQKKASFMLLIINAGALILIFSVGFLLFRIFTKEESKLVSRQGFALSTEGRILKALREETTRELEDKNDQISAIEEKLAVLEAEKHALGNEIESRLTSREAELQKEFEVKLQEERKRLMALGMTEKTLEEALKEYQAQEERQLETELQKARTAFLQEKEQREAEINAILQETQDSFVAAEKERLRLTNTLKEQKTALEERLKIQEETTAGELDSLTQNLRNLQITQEQDKIVTNQILSFYSNISSALAEEDFDKALEIMDTLEAYLNTENIESLPSVRERKSTDTALTASLQNLITVAAAQRAAPSVAELQEQINFAEEELQNWEDRQTAWETVQESLLQEQSSLKTRQSLLLEERDALRTEQQRLIRAQQDLVNSAQRLTSSRENSSLSQDQQGLLLSAIAELQEEYQARLDLTEDQEQQILNSLIPLLDTQLIIKKILIEPEIKERYPELDSSYDVYTEIFTNIRAIDAYKKAYQEVLSFLKNLENLTTE